MRDTQTEKSRLYEGLDAAHTPRLIVPERYVEEGSRKLLDLAAWALLSSQRFPDKQYDVVWLGQKVTRFLRAEVQPTGWWGNSFGHGIEDSDDLFLPDPGVFESGDSYVGRIERALENGAGVYKPADLAPRAE